MDVIALMKLLGAGIGSSIAIIFEPNGDSKLILFKRFILGAIIGFITSPIIIDYLGFKHTLDYWLACSTAGGLVGYLILQVLFSGGIKERLKSMIGEGK